MTTKKREYEKPSVRVFVLRQRPQLLAMSDPSNYPNGGNPFYGN